MKALCASICGFFCLLPLAFGWQPVVAVHDSEYTRALAAIPASGATPNTSGSTTGFQWWVTNWNYFTVVQSIKEAGPRLFNMHMKDLTSFQSKESQVPVGEGIMPVREIFQALIAMNYSGFVDLEYEIHPEDPMPGIIASFAYMRGVIAGMNLK